MHPDNLGQPFYNNPGAPPINAGQPMTASQIKRSKPTSLIIALVVCVVLLIGSLGFGFWAFAGMQSYKDTSDKKIAGFVKTAEEAQSKKDDAIYAEKEKSPHKTYTSQSTAGSIGITYPKTWSAFVTESEKSATPVDGYFHPGFVPGLQSGTSFALRVQVLNQSYDQVMRTFESSAKTGKSKISAYRADKVPAILGSRVDGEIAQNQQGILVVLPLRDKTIKISTESLNFSADFNNTVLANLIFLP